MIGAPTKFTTSGQLSHNFGLSSSTNNYIETFHPVIAALNILQKIICELFGRIGLKSDACIIFGPKFLPPSLRRKIIQFKALYVNEPTDPPIEWSKQPPSAHFKFRNFPPKTSPVVSAIMGRINHHATNNGGVVVHP